MLGITESKRSGWPRMIQLDSITDSMAMHLNKLRDIAEDRRARCWSGLISWRRDRNQAQRHRVPDVAGERGRDQASCRRGQASGK